MRYERQAFAGVGAEASLRVTFDEALRYRFRDLVPRPCDDDFDGRALAEGRHVMEIKVDSSLPYWLSLLVGKAGCTLRGVSKYSMAVEAAGLEEAEPGDAPSVPLLAGDRRR
jgi:hypothetical protein